MKSATKLSRKERERLRHRQEILSAALRLFAEKGFRNVSMQEIAAVAEFSTGTLYNFFANKEDLFFEVLVASAEKAFELILPTLEGPDDERRKLARFIQMHERMARELSDMIRLYLLESHDRYVPGGRVEAKKKEFGQRVTSQLAEVVAAGVRKGFFNDIDPLIAAKCLVATLESIVLADNDLSAGDLKGDLRKVEAVFFQGLLRSSGGKCDA